MKIIQINFVYVVLFLVCNTMRKIIFIGRRRGIINVVSGAILLSGVTLIGTGAVVWTQTTVNTREHDTGVHYTSVMNKIKESLTLEKFWYNTPSQKLNLVLKNTADIGLNVTEIEIQGSNNQIIPIAGAAILPNAFYTAQIKYDWLGDPIDIFVKTARGSIFRMHIVSPTDGILILNKVSVLGNGNFSYDGDLGKFNVTTAGFTPGESLDANGNLVITGIIRDFNATGTQGGHPDFEKQCCPPSYGVYTGIVMPTLGPDREPVYNNYTTSPWNSGFTRFNQWYHDTPGVNVKQNLNITLIRQVGVNPPTWAYNNGSYFPIDNQLFCKSNPTCSGKDGSGKWHNFHFTFEAHSSFTYQGGEKFVFSGDDDVWVFINNRLALDLGGVHSNQTATVDLDAQSSQLGITKGGTYNFDFFYAERHTVSSEMKMTTSIKLNKNGSGRTSAFFVDPGTYTINELVPAGWSLTNRQCDNGYTLPNSTEVTVTVPKGVTICTFTNTK